MLEVAFSRYVYKKSLEALRGMARTSDPPKPPAHGAPMLLYLHVPFCEELCGYCTFNRERFEAGLAHRYFAALREEIAIYHDKGYTFGSVYVGGGTPTVLPEELASTMALVRSLWNPKVISVETHPEHITERACSLMEEAGVNRLSIGVQSFQEPVLRSLQRKSHHITFEETCSRLRRTIASFRTVNVDMIFGVPGQTADTLRNDISAIKSLLPHQITYYPLMRDRAADSHRGVPSRRFYALVVEGLSECYRLSSGWSFSLVRGNPLEEYITEGEDYAGLGSGSFGYVDGVFYANTFSIKEYVRAISERFSPIIVSRRFRPSERMRYYSLMNLFDGRLLAADAIRRFGFLPLLQLWKDCLMFAMAGGLSLGGRSLGLNETSGYRSMLMMKEFFTAIGELRKFCRSISFDRDDALA